MLIFLSANINWLSFIYFQINKFHIHIYTQNENLLAHLFANNKTLTLCAYLWLSLVKHAHTSAFCFFFQSHDFHIEWICEFVIIIIFYLYIWQASHTIGSMHFVYNKFFFLVCKIRNLHMNLLGFGKGATSSIKSNHSSLALNPLKEMLILRMRNGDRNTIRSANELIYERMKREKIHIYQLKIEIHDIAWWDWK